MGDTLAALLGESHLFGQAKPRLHRCGIEAETRFRHAALTRVRLDAVIPDALAEAPEERLPTALQLRDNLDVVWGRRGLWQSERRASGVDAPGKTIAAGSRHLVALAYRWGWTCARRSTDAANAVAAGGFETRRRGKRGGDADA